MTIVLNEDGTQTSSSRLERIDCPISLPGKCVLCGVSSSEKGFLNFTGPPLDFDYYGVVIFCETCVASMAGTFGYLPPEERERLESRLNAAEIELSTHRQALLALEAAVESLTDLRILRGDMPPPSSISSDLTSPFSEYAPEPVNVDNSQPEQRIDSDEKSTSEQGSSDISGSSAIDDILGIS